MTVLDYILIAIVAVSTSIGLMRGLVSEVIALAAWVLAFIVARQFGGDVALLLPAGLQDPGLRMVSGFALAFVAVLLLCGVLRWVLRSLIKATGLDFPDRVLGGLFGLARAAFILLLIVVGAAFTPAPEQPWWRAAALTPPLETAAIALRPWLPDAVAKKIRFKA
ncbi:CvpA family protein [Methyloversatilis sp.]|uniref:CvpA family protein n=1 Tax=Methyloversatilis sp. TaxID=2569862 RepID=UPI0027356A6E|nr:CvpA family protein [Methyloversatilis sp.]MDP2868972.1 CvpA family protein [Methyloversatilis sp.]MDP3287108.1 CvpA family protein [Methyloversatilis sp.]MDP3454597.1 CvpA family protein [Methyloversatilis sp.]MDP3580193.1 CvpA family protein [Methyloversatilis sp.]